MSRQTQDPSRINAVRFRKHFPYRTAVGLSQPSAGTLTQAVQRVDNITFNLGAIRRGR